MQQIHLANTNLTVSELCLGCMQLGSRATVAESTRLLDSYRAAGGTFFDTAHCYSFWLPCHDGASERALGDYVRANKCRDEMIIASKGAHPAAPGYRQTSQFMAPYRVEADIDDSLARLRIDCIDLYWLHRDNPRVPVGEIVEMLNTEVRRGRIRAFGGSNWSSERLAEANRYAAAHNIAGFVASQPRWSLLQYEPQSHDQRLEPGVLLDFAAADHQWHCQSQLPVMAYGSTGNGFFATAGKTPEKFATAVNCRRAQRAADVAADLAVTPNQVALAWLMHQAFPVIPILGTANLCHLEDALASTQVKLSPAQVDYLQGA